MERLCKTYYSIDKFVILGISTGYGAVLNTCKVEAGATVAVWGLGAVGLATIMGAKSAGAKRIVAIDTNNERKKLGTNEIFVSNFLNKI